MPDLSDASTETKLVAETVVTSYLINIAVNMAMQLALMDGGSFTTVRAVLARGDMEMRPARVPPIVPVPAGSYDEGLARGIADAKLADLPKILAERAAAGLISAGVKIKR